MSSPVNSSKHNSKQLHPRHPKQSYHPNNDHAASVPSAGSAWLPAVTPSWKSPDDCTCRIPGCCGRTFNRTYDLARHLTRKKHRRAMASAADETIRAAGVPEDLLESARQRLRQEISCEACQQSFTRNDSFLKHLTSTKHQRNAGRMGHSLSQPMMTPPPGYKWVLSPLPGLPAPHTGSFGVEIPSADAADPGSRRPATSDDDTSPSPSVSEPPRSDNPDAVYYFTHDVAPNRTSRLQQSDLATSSSLFGLPIGDTFWQPQPDFIAYSSPISPAMSYQSTNFTPNVAASEPTDDNVIWPPPPPQLPALVPGLFEESMESWFPS